MNNIFQHFKELFFLAMQQIASSNQVEISSDDYQKFTIEPAKEQLHGDLACNIAMTFSKKFSAIKSLNQPKLLAQELINKLSEREDIKNSVDKFEIAGAGFINIFTNNNIIHQALLNIIKNDEFNFPNIGNQQAVNLEYASPNPTGPMHIGHTRGAIYGDVLANLLIKTGFNVLKEYYINDAGSQIKTLVKSVYYRYCQLCNIPQDQLPSFEGLYPGDYLIKVAEIIKNNFQDSLINSKEEDFHHKTEQIILDEMLAMIKEDLFLLGIKHNSYFSEYQNLHLTGKIEQAINKLNDLDLLYYGKLELPKTNKGVGAINNEELEEADSQATQNQLIFKSTLFGDDQDRVVKKGDGSYTYLAGDLGYILSKFERGAKVFIMPLGYDHAGYVKRLTAVTKALTNDQATIKIILCQMVKFIKNGEPLKMSKRAGNFITAREVIDEVGADVLRFIMLTRKNDAPFDFDLAKVVEQSKDNPIFYVQYAHARCCSILRNAELEGFKINDILENANLENLKLLTTQEELNLIKKIANFVRVIEMATQSFEPHRIAFYLQELASELHSLWHKGNENHELKFIIKNNSNLTNSRLLLVFATKKIIATGLEIFNIKPCEEMK